MGDYNSIFKHLTPDDFIIKFEQKPIISNCASKCATAKDIEATTINDKTFNVGLDLADNYSSLTKSFWVDQPKKTATDGIKFYVKNNKKKYHVNYK